MDDKQRVALIETRTHPVGADPAPRQLVRFQLGNHLGSVALELDDEAKVISYEEFHPYGTTAYEAARSHIETPKRYRYTGKEKDEETGLTYHGDRYYAPWFGRWISYDPSGLIDGTNLYRYARNAPTRYSDPSGRDPTDDERMHKDDEQLKAIGVTRQEVIDFTMMNRGEFMVKYGLRRWWNFPRDQVRALPGAMIARILPPTDTTLYLQPNGHVSTNADETARNVRNFNPGTPLGGVTSTLARGGAAVLGASHENTELAAGIAGAFGDLGNAALASKGSATRGVGTSVPDTRAKQWGAPVHNTPTAVTPRPSTPPVAKPAIGSPTMVATPKAALRPGALSENPKNLPSPKTLVPSFPDFNPNEYCTNCAEVAIRADRWLGGSRYTKGAGNSGRQTMEQIEEQFGNKFYDSTINEAKTVLQDTGPGSRGLLAFGKGDEAHIVNVINWHGKVIAIDAQNMTYGTITEVIKNSGYTGSGPMQFMFTHRAR